MGKRTDKAKRDAKFAFRKGRSETIANIRAEREAAFAKMFADVIDETSDETIESLSKLGLTLEVK